MSLRVIVDPFFVSLSMHMREDAILAKVICVDMPLTFRAVRCVRSYYLPCLFNIPFSTLIIHSDCRYYFIQAVKRYSSDSFTSVFTVVEIYFA